MENVVIAGAARTPIGGFNGGLSAMPATELGRVAVTAALDRAGVDPEQVDEVVLGCVLQAALGQNPARQTSMRSGVPKETPAMTVNQVCGSGLRAAAVAWQGLAVGDSKVAVAGGMENMSLSPHASYLRSGHKMGPVNFEDVMIKDGLWDAFHDYHMGITAENIAEKWQITRDRQDTFSVASHQKAEAAWEAGRFDAETVPVTIKGRKGDTIVERDEHFRPGATMDMVSRLKPAFKREDGSVTAANSSGINDGAAALVMMTESEAERRGVNPLARIVSWAHVGVDPAIMGIGPSPASKKALEKAGWSVGDLELAELNEAFAAQSCAVLDDLGIDPEIVNVNGGAIALGHPIGASGARVVVTLLHEMERRKAKKGLAALCIGGGMGIAMCFERP